MRNEREQKAEPIGRRGFEMHQKGKDALRENGNGLGITLLFEPISGHREPASAKVRWNVRSQDRPRNPSQLRFSIVMPFEIRTQP